MNTQSPSSPDNNGDLQTRFDSLEKRLSKIEEFLDYKLAANLRNPVTQEKKVEEFGSGVSEDAAESQFGEQIFSWISGIVVLFLVVFIMTFFQSKEKSGLAILVGYGTTFGVLLIGQMIKKSFPKQVYLLRVTSHILLFYTTLWLHFFSSPPFIGSTLLGLAVIGLPIGYLMYFAFKQKSEILAILATLMVFTTAILANQTHVTLGLLSLVAAFSLFVNYLKGWSKLFQVSIIAVYLVALLWLLGNPIAGNPDQTLTTPQGSLFYLFSFGFIFSMIAFQKPKSGFSQSVVTASTVLNGILFAGILIYVISKFYPQNYSVIFAAIALFSLAFSALLKIKEAHFVITTFYAVISFVAMSVMIYGLVDFPNAFMWLVLQSLLVVSIALWFRVPLIVIANTLMFFGILAFYLIKGDIQNSTNIAIAVIALVSARFINWQKERLNLKTEAIRNTYLIGGLFSTLFAFYHLFPDKFISISWLGAAGLFFGLSFILEAKKYRWMAFATLIASVIYLFFFQLKSMEIGFRIVAFLIIAIITLVTSFYYSKRSRS